MRMGAAASMWAAACRRTAWAITSPARTATTATISMGSSQRRTRTRRLCARALPRGRRAGPREWRAGRPKVRAVSAMGENVDLFPSGHVQAGAMRQEVEAGLGQVHAALADQHGVESDLEGVQVEDIRRGVGHLVGRKLSGAPIRALLG